MNVQERMERFTKEELLAVRSLAAIKAIRERAREMASREDVDIASIAGWADAALDRMRLWRRVEVWAEAGDEAALAGALFARIAALERARRSAG